MAMAAIQFNPPTVGGIDKVPLTDAATITTDASAGDIFYVTFGGSRTMAKPTNGYDGQTITYWITQSGNKTVTWGSGFSATADIALPTLTSGSTATDMFAFVYNATNDKWYILAVDKGAA